MSGATAGEEYGVVNLDDHVEGLRRGDQRSTCTPAEGQYERVDVQRLLNEDDGRWRVAGDRRRDDGRGLRQGVGDYPASVGVSLGLFKLVTDHSPSPPFLLEKS